MNQDLCVICQIELIRDIPGTTCTLGCNHVFHVNCLNQLMEHQQRCPVCRRQIDLCVICRKEFTRDIPETTCTLGCDHVFHVNCMNKWIENHQSCPVCRTQIVEIRQESRFGLPEEVNAVLLINTNVAVENPPGIHNRQEDKGQNSFLCLVFLFICCWLFGRLLDFNESNCHHKGCLLWEISRATVDWGEIYRDAMDWGSSLFSPKKCSKTDILTRYRGAVLDRDFMQEVMRTGEITISVNSKRMETGVKRQDLDKIVLFHVALINKYGVDLYMHTMENGVLVIARYCEQNQLCIAFKVNTNGLWLQNNIRVPFKTVLEKKISFKFDKGNFLITLSRRKSNYTIACLPAINLNGFALVAGLGYPNFARTTLSFGNLTVSCQVHKKIYLSTDRHAISNYNGFEKPDA